MEEIAFTKMEGAGNDYVYVDALLIPVSQPERLAREISHRRFGIGSDGLVLIVPSQTADLRMIMYNADGSPSDMCGNAIRCVGKYAWEHGLVNNTNIRVETGDGVKKLNLFLDRRNEVKTVSVEMGVPEFRAPLIPSTLTDELIVERLFDFDDFCLKGTLVSMGNPHFVTYVEDIGSVPVSHWGPDIEYSEYFPDRINIEFVQILSKTEVMQRTWERGSGETWACGTGAAAVCVAGVAAGRTESDLLVRLKGGELNLSWPGMGHSVIKTGPAREVFTGIWKRKWPPREPFLPFGHREYS